jgi:hypothetical protein
MNDFDRALRHAVKADPEGVLRWLFPNLSRRWRFVRWFDAQSAPRPGEPARRCDTIAELTDSEGTRQPRAVIVELFADPDSDADDRVLEYIGRYRRELRHGPDRLPFLAAMIFLANGPQRVGWQADLPDEDPATVSTNFQPKALCVDRESAVATLQAISENRLSLGVLAFVPAMQGGATLGVVQRWRELVTGVEDLNHLRTLCDLAIVLADKTNSRPLWRQELEGFPLNESSYMRDARNETTRRAILTVLEARFPNTVPPELRELIQSQRDPNELDRWISLAATALDIPAFRTATGL